MDDEVLLAAVLAFPQEKTGELSCGSPIAEAPGEALSRCAFLCHTGGDSHTLRMKSVHGIRAGNVEAYLLE
jgi:hypothetical protein